VGESASLSIPSSAPGGTGSKGTLAALARRCDEREVGGMGGTFGDSPMSAALAKAGGSTDPTSGDGSTFISGLMI
jgi:hypothetical protein